MTKITTGKRKKLVEAQKKEKSEEIMKETALP